jgi:hypothetical protein
MKHVTNASTIYKKFLSYIGFPSNLYSEFELNNQVGKNVKEFCMSPESQLIIPGSPTISGLADLISEDGLNGQYVNISNMLINHDRSCH